MILDRQNRSEFSSILLLILLIYSFLSNFEPHIVNFLWLFLLFWSFFRILSHFPRFFVDFDSFQSILKRFFINFKRLFGLRIIQEGKKCHFWRFQLIFWQITSACSAAGVENGVCRQMHDGVQQIPVGLPPLFADRDAQRQNGRLGTEIRLPVPQIESPKQQIQSRRQPTIEGMRPFLRLQSGFH